MPEDEAQEQTDAKEGEGGGGGFLGARAWLLVALAEGLIIVAIFVFMHVRDMDKKEEEQDDGEAKVGETFDYYGMYNVALENLNYTISMSTGNSMTLSMKLMVMLGRSEDERQNSIDIPKEDWEKYQEAVKRMDPKVRDRLNQHIRQQSYSQLNSQSGQEKIKKLVKEYINGELRNIQFKELKKPDVEPERVTEVLIQDFYIQ